MQFTDSTQVTIVLAADLFSMPSRDRPQLMALYVLTLLPVRSRIHQAHEARPLQFKDEPTPAF